MRPTVPAIEVIGDDDQGNLEIDTMIKCGSCLELFSVGNPLYVTTANAKPICSKCIHKANPRRLSKGLPPIPFDPRGYKLS